MKLAIFLLTAFWLGAAAIGVADNRTDSAADADGTKVRVAAISFVPKTFDLAGNADRLGRAFRQAKVGGAQMAVTSEGCLEGYEQTMQKLGR